MRLSITLSIVTALGALTVPSSALAATAARFVHVERFPSAVLGNARNITVMLPPSYEAKGTRRYPVLYANDGQNLFDERTAFIGREWKMDETLLALYAAKAIPEIIVVGIWNTPARLEEYTPGPSGDRYLRFVSTELKPFIDARYRTWRGPKGTSVLGSSMGGLISTWAALSFPDVFGQSASLSAAFQFKGEAISEVLKTQPKKKVRMYLDIGTDELPGENGAKFAGYMAQMRESLASAGYVEGRDLRTLIIPGGKHNEDAWAARLRDPLIFLYGRSAPAGPPVVPAP